MFTVCANACFNLFTMDWVKPPPPPEGEIRNIEAKMCKTQLMVNLDMMYKSATLMK